MTDEASEPDDHDFIRPPLAIAGVVHGRYGKPGERVMSDEASERSDGRRICPACGCASYVIVGEPWSQIAALQSQLTAANARITELETSLRQSVEHGAAGWAKAAKVGEQLTESLQKQRSLESNLNEAVRSAGKAKRELRFNRWYG